MKLVSPNDLQDAAIDQMLNGHEPASTKDWQMVVNFWAANIGAGLEEPACKVIAMLFGCPLPDSDLEQIVQFQVDRK